MDYLPWLVAAAIRRPQWGVWMLGSKLIRCSVVLSTAVMALASWSASGSQARAEDVIRFGAALSLTGGLSTEAKQCKDGYDFYVKQINQRGGILVGGMLYSVNLSTSSLSSGTFVEVSKTKSGCALRTGCTKVVASVSGGV